MKNNVDQFDEKTAMETLFSYLDKGIDDMESGRHMPILHHLF